MLLDNVLYKLVSCSDENQMLMCAIFAFFIKTDCIEDNILPFLYAGQVYYCCGSSTLLWKDLEFRKYDSSCSETSFYMCAYEN